MGSVYEAEETSGGRHVAVKVIHADRRLSDDLVRRFRREARAAMSVSSRHIAQVLDAGADMTSGTPYMVMEFLVGEDLEALARRLGPLPPEAALRIVGQACAGMEVAHQAGIVHRDIKPANLFLARSGGEIVVKIVDFGIAKILQDRSPSAETTGLTSTGSMLGSPLYMSPEQARGIKGIDHRSDVWSLGVVLYRALTGRAPHQGIEAFGDLIIAISTRAATPIQEISPWVRPEVAAIAHAALRVSPSERFQTAGEMLERIRALLPGGLELSEEMLVPLSDAERMAVAPRSQEATLDASKKAAGSIDGLGSTLKVEAAPEQSARDITTGPSPAPMASRRWAPLAVGAAVLAALVGLGVHRAAQPDGGAPAEVAPPPASSDRGLERRRIELRITPADAEVEVDGAPGEARGGVVEIAGALGSVHRVRIWKGASDAIADVVVTEAGALPRELALVEAPPASSTEPPAPAGSHPAPARKGPPGKASTTVAAPPASSSPVPKPSGAPPPGGTAPPASSSEIRESFE